MTDTGTFLRTWFDELTASGWTSEVFLARLSDDVVWTATGTSPVSGVYHGLAEYTDGVYRKLDAVLESWPQPHVERIIAEGEWGVVEFSSTGGRGKNGVDYNMRYCWLMRVENDHVTEVVGYYDTSKVEALFS